MAQNSAPTLSNTGRPNFCRTPKHTIGLISERTHRVETRHGEGSQIVDELTASFATEECASLVQRVIADSLRNDLTVAETRAALVERLQYEYANECQAHYRKQAYLADLDRAIDIFTPQATRERLDEMAADLRVSMAGVL